MTFYRRHLPHWIPKDRPIFVTWCLKGSISKGQLNKIRAARKQIREFMKLHGAEKDKDFQRHAKLIFTLSEQALENENYGPTFLNDAECAKIVSDRILLGAEKWYDLYTFVIMPNHVHMLIVPIEKLKRITKGIKGTTAREINKTLNRTGQAFWQDESFDHWLRSESKILKCIQYIEDNPVKAGLCHSDSEWRWSSASMRSV